MVLEVGTVLDAKSSGRWLAFHFPVVNGDANDVVVFFSRISRSNILVGNGWWWCWCCFRFENRSKNRMLSVPIQLMRTPSVVPRNYCTIW